jgi:hypothetical protein
VDEDLLAAYPSTVVLGEGVLRLLAEQGRGRLVIMLIEDLHWAYPETLAVLEYITDHANAQPVHLLLTYRSRSHRPAACTT